MKFGHILGMNARNHLFTSRYNKRESKRIADSKLLTKSTLQKSKLPVPRLYRVFRSEGDLEKYDLMRLPEEFVIKPNKGLGGEGIVVVEKRGKYAGEWVTADGREVNVSDLKLHVHDILEGRFSRDDLPDIAFVEERVRIHSVFEKHAYHGTPDIRVIVFNRVPVMAMLRIPTQDSAGRANLFQGAVGAGVDLATGITTYAISYTKEIVFMPGTRRKVRGIQIPEWDKVLELAVRCQEVSGLGYLGADIVLQPSIKTLGKTFPKVLELNSQPGLKIQLCNKAGLRRRLERVEGLDVDDFIKGIKIAKQLFGDRKLSHLEKGAITIGPFEEVEVVGIDGERKIIKALIDTGAYSSSIDEPLARELGLLTPESILYQGSYSSALGHQKRPVVLATFYLAGKKIKTKVNVADRSRRKRKFLVGRRDLSDFSVELKKN